MIPSQSATGKTLPSLHRRELWGNEFKEMFSTSFFNVTRANMWCHGIQKMSMTLTVESVPFPLHISDKTAKKHYSCDSGFG